ncbi:MAG: 3'(2'),5'-bisphosphate nucleotidase CysQ, partial [Candidatus Pacebacteria bacterium]|nr:3'(2'),5'-bisphosphate nucleotidase CysQ [Candidatus Paceibacterota bacterium]
MNNKDISLEEVIAIVRKAGERTLDFFDIDIDVKKKDDNSPVTEADLASNEILIDGLSKYGIPILSEEMISPESLDDDLLWIIDPLDGTSSFIKGQNDHSVMVGLVYKGEPILGVVYQSSVNVLYYAKKSEGAYVERDGKTKKLFVSGTDQISKAKLVVSRRAKKKEAFIKKIKEMNVKEIHYLNSNGVKLGLIAEGEYDLFFNPSGKLGQWDYCAPHIIFEEAGGVVTYLDGEKVLYGKKWDNNS